MQIKNIFDPVIFHPSLVDQETVQFNKEVENLMNDLPPMYTLTPREIRDARESGKGIFGEIIPVDEAEERTIPGPDGDVPIRLFVPDEINGIYLHIHGGGFMLGRAHHQDPLLLSIAKGA